MTRLEIAITHAFFDLRDAKHGYNYLVPARTDAITYNITVLIRDLRSAVFKRLDQ